MTRRPATVHCFQTKREALEAAYESTHGPNSFHGSKAWLATKAPGWGDGVCMRDAGHLGSCVYEELGGEKEKRKAS